VQRIDQVFEEMPPKEKNGLAIYRDRLAALEANLLPDEPIVTATRSGFPFGTMVVTSKRLIVVLQDGGTQVISFSEITSLSLIEGSKKLMGLGSRGPSTLVTRYRNGSSNDNISLGYDGEWGVRAGREIIASHERYSIRHSG
jgi:hypothetical protein